jgi:hypothetical protein
MTDLRLTEQLKKRALERWENEGGKFFDDRTREQSARWRKGTNSLLPNEDRNSDSDQINGLAESSL